jgi:hypothetical protein
MTAMGRRGLVAGGLIGAALCFSLGWLASRAVDTPKREPTATPTSKPTSIDVDDGGALEPLLLIDPAKVMLLPDASLNLDLPTPPSVPGQTDGRRD